MNSMNSFVLSYSVIIFAPTFFASWAVLMLRLLVSRYTMIINGPNRILHLLYVLHISSDGISIIILHAVHDCLLSRPFPPKPITSFSSCRRHPPSSSFAVKTPSVFAHDQHSHAAPTFESLYNLEGLFATFGATSVVRNYLGKGGDIEQAVAFELSSAGCR